MTEYDMGRETVREKERVWAREVIKVKIMFCPVTGVM